MIKQNFPAGLFLAFICTASLGVRAQSLAASAWLQGGATALQNSAGSGFAGVVPPPGPAAASAVTATPAAPPAFTGTASTGCQGLDYSSYLKNSRAADLIAQFQAPQSGGTQEALGNYLLALHYSNPTLATAVDMADRKLSDRYAALAQACQAQGRSTVSEGSTALTQAADECFDQLARSGSDPETAYRQCYVAHAVPAGSAAAASHHDFLRMHTPAGLPADSGALLDLLPERRIQGGNYQTQAPSWSIEALAQALQQQTRTALDRLDDGAKPEQLAACSPANMRADRGTAAAGCLTDAARALVLSPAYRGSRLLDAASRNAYKDALAARLALLGVHESLLELQQSFYAITSMPAEDAQHAQARRAQLFDELARLRQRAELLMQREAVRSQALRTQILAQLRLQDQMERRGANLRGQGGGSGASEAWSAAALAVDHR